MSNHRKAGHKRTHLVVAIAAAACLTFGAGVARASQAAGAITQVEFNAANATFPQFILQLNSATTNYYAQAQTSPGCGITALSADSLKAMQSFAQTAFLAGKTVNVSFTPCGGFNYIFGISMAR
jgi:hypothetical protein